VDLPGYGFAKSSFHKRKDWAPLLEEYFAKRDALKAVVIFMDIRHPLKDSDRDMIDLCNASDVAFIPVLTKSDKFSNNQKFKAISAVNKKMQDCEALAVSSKDNVGFDRLSKAILEFC
jgi:GTP-binding protein